jgi:hypothetical protein
MISYLTTALGLAVVVAATDPTVIHGAGIVTGLFVGMSIWLATEILATRVRNLT